MFEMLLIMNISLNSFSFPMELKHPNLILFFNYYFNFTYLNVDNENVYNYREC